MNKTQARKLGAALAAAGVIEFPGTAGKLSKAQRSTHGATAIVGHWAETEQRAAPARGASIVCVNVAEAMLGGWSVDALRSCSHTANAQRRTAETMAEAAS